MLCSLRASALPLWSGNNFVTWNPRDGIELRLHPVKTYVRGTCVALKGASLNRTEAPSSARFADTKIGIKH
jgi:hypothetical protein